MNISITRERNAEQQYDIGLREATTTTQGMYELDWTISGMMMAEHSEWLQYVFASMPLIISENSVAINEQGVESSFSGDTPVYVIDSTLKDPDTGAYKPADINNAISLGSVPYSYFQNYIPITTTGTREGYSRIYRYINGNGPKVFDMAIAQEDANTLQGADYTEYSILCGCIINSCKISYENGSNAAVSFEISGSALVDPTILLSTPAPDYRTKVEGLKGDVFVFGCMQAGDAADQLEEVALTDSSSLEINTSVQKRPGCGAGWYKSYSFGTIKYSLSTKTYSDNPQKYLSKLYGYGKNDSFGTGPSPSYPKLSPYILPYMRLRTQSDSGAGTIYFNRFMDINMNNVSISNLGKTLNVDDPIMDEPSLSPRNVQIVIRSLT